MTRHLKWTPFTKRHSRCLLSVPLLFGVLQACSAHKTPKNGTKAGLAVAVTLPKPPSQFNLFGSSETYFPFHIVLKFSNTSGFAQTLALDPASLETSLTLPYGDVKVEALVLGMPMPAGQSKADYCAKNNESKTSSSGSAPSGSGQGSGSAGSAGNSSQFQVFPSGVANPNSSQSSQNKGSSPEYLFAATGVSVFSVGDNTDSVPVLFDAMQQANFTSLGLRALSRDTPAPSQSFALADVLTHASIKDPCSAKNVEFKSDSTGRIVDSIPTVTNAEPLFGLNLPNGVFAPLNLGDNSPLGHFLDLNLETGKTNATPADTDFFALKLSLKDLAARGNGILNRVLALTQSKNERNNGSSASALWTSGLPLPAPVVILNQQQNTPNNSVSSGTTPNSSTSTTPNANNVATSNVLMSLSNALSPLRAGGTLQCGVMISLQADQSVAKLVSEFRWLLNNSPLTSSTSNARPDIFKVPLNAKKDDIISCQARVVDPADSAAANASVWAQQSLKIEADPLSLSVFDKTIAGDSTVAFSDADIQASDEGQPNAFYSFDNDGATGTKCALKGNLSGLNSRTGAFTFAPALYWSGNCNIKLNFSDAFGGTVSSQFTVTVSPVNHAPFAPTMVTVTPAAATVTSTLTCSPTGGSDPDGNNVSYMYYWFKGMTLLTGANSNMLSGRFSKGDAISCSVQASDGVLTSTLVPSNVITIQNSAPLAPTAVTLNSSVPSKTGNFNCSATAGTDSDGDTTSFVYSWRVNGTLVAGETNSTLLGSNASVFKGATVTCDVAMNDGTLTSPAASSSGITVQNSPLSGSVSCTGAVPHALGKIGGNYSVNCSGASDPDGNGDFSYQLVTVSGSCPSMTASGNINGMFAGAGTCAYNVKACDSGGCTSPSSTYKISSYDLTASLGAPTLDANCGLTFPGTATPSANISGLAYVGDSGLLGTAATSTGLFVTLNATNHTAGSYSANWGVSSGTIDVLTANTGVNVAAGYVNYVLTKSSPAVLAQRVPAATLDGNVQVGRQVPAAPPGASKCLSVGSGNFAMIVAGGQHTCALTSADGVKCWGDNSFGQLGDGSTTQRLTPVDVNGLTSGVEGLSVGFSHTCALTSAGGVKCWGNNTNGQLGDGTTTPRLTAVDGGGLVSGVASLSVGSNHTCALTSAGGVKCWGGNASGQLGNGSTTQSLTPVNVTGLGSGIVGLSAGSSYTCALTSGGGVKCWGGNSSGQLGDGTGIQSTTPVNVNGLGSGVVALSASATHTCALTSAGGVKCWGSNGWGEIGDGTTNIRTAPVDVNGLPSGVVALASGSTHTCALTSTGNVKCWGKNGSGQLGDGTDIQRTTAVVVSGLGSGIVALSAGTDHNCALTNAGAVKCWGDNSRGQLGDGTALQRTTSVDVSGLSTGVAAFAAGFSHTCALTSGGGAKCWGGNGNGQLGDGTLTDRPAPVDVAGLTTGVVALTTGDSDTCALTSGGAVKCWGYNPAGQVGDGSTLPRYTPVGVSGLPSGVAAIAAGRFHNCAITTGGAAKCWGDNTFGQLGDGTTTNQPTPVSVSGLGAGITALSAGHQHTCALTSAGAVKCWGDNTYGQLGDGSTNPHLTYAGVNGLSSGVVAIAAGYRHTCALTSAGAVKCWGDNASGQIGDTTVTQRLAPVSVNGLASGVSGISASQWHTCALTTGGGVKCWGDNTSGQLGDATVSQRLMPVDVSGLTSGVTAVVTGSYSTCARTSGGGGKCWGSDYWGQLGDNVPDPLSIRGVTGLSAIAFVQWIFGI